MIGFFDLCQRISEFLYFESKLSNNVDALYSITLLSINRKLHSNKRLCKQMNNKQWDLILCKEIAEVVYQEFKATRYIQLQSFGAHNEY